MKKEAIDMKYHWISNTTDIGWGCRALVFYWSGGRDSTKYRIEERYVASHNYRAYWFQYGLNQHTLANAYRYSIKDVQIMKEKQ